MGSNQQAPLDPSQRESLSAWMDGEGADRDLSVLLTCVRESSDLLEIHDDWQVVREALHNATVLETAPSTLHQRVRAQVLAEAEFVRASGVSANHPEPQATPVPGFGWLHRWGAVAAVVTAVGFVGLVAWSSFERPEAWMSANVGGIATSPSVPTASIDPERLREYLEAHRSFSVQGASGVQSAVYVSPVANGAEGGGAWR